MISALGEAMGRLPRSVRFLIWAAVSLGGWAVLASLLERGAPPGLVLRGVVIGSLYALSTIGLVLVYRANRIINFAQADLGSVAAVVAIELVVVEGWNFFAAVAVGVVLAALMGAVVDKAVVRRLRNAPRLILTVATIGIQQILAGVAILIPTMWQGPLAGRFTTPFEFSFTVDQIVFSADYALVLVIVPIALVGIATFLRRSDYGIAVRAAAENADRAHLLGLPVRRLSTVVWATAALLSATAVMLRVPLLGFVSFGSVSGGGSSLLLRSLTAAVIGRMERLPTAVAAAIGIGIFDEIASSQFGNTTHVDAALVLIIIVALLVQRDAFTRAAETGIRSFQSIREVRPIPAELRRLPEVRGALWIMRRGLVLGAALVPVFASSTHIQASSLLLIYALVALSLLILTGWSGQISLGQFALVGFGGATTAVLYGRHGWDFLLALPAGVIAGGLAAVVIGVPALRIRGPFLAVTTLGFALTSSSLLLKERYVPWFVEPRIEAPVLWGRIDLGADWVLYETCLVVLVLAVGAARNLRQSAVGRAILAVRDNEAGSSAAAIGTTTTKLVAFAISGGIAGLAGGLYVVHQGGLATDAFHPEVSIRLFSMVVIGGLGSVPGAILGASYVRGAEFFLPAGWELLASGAGILALLMMLPDGLGGLMYRIRDGLLRLIARRRQILVPSLLADRREAPQDEPDMEKFALGAGGDTASTDASQPDSQTVGT